MICLLISLFITGYWLGQMFCGGCGSTHAYILVFALSKSSPVMGLATVSVLLLLCCVATTTDYDPSPNPEAVVQVGKARFTVLTDHLIRMEWGGANDAATLAFVNRNLPTPKFTTSKDGNWTIIQTSAVEVSSRIPRMRKQAMNPHIKPELVACTRFRSIIGYNLLKILYAHNLTSSQATGPTM